MKRIVVALAVVALVVGLLPVFLFGPASATSDLSLPLVAGTPGLSGPELSREQPPPAFAASLDAPLMARLESEGGAAMHLSPHAATGRIRFLGSDPLAGPFQGIRTGVAGDPAGAARAFLDAYGSLFGVHGAAEVRIESEKSEGERTVVRFQQHKSGIPVIGGELIVQSDAAGTIWSVSGEAWPDAVVVREPRITAETARAAALAVVRKNYGADPALLLTTDPELWYFVPALMGTPPPAQNALVWRLEVSATDLSPIRELVLVDAIKGSIVLNFSQIAEGKTRVVYDKQNVRGDSLPGGSPVRSEGQGTTGQIDVDRAYDYAGDTYDFYLSTHGRDSIDAAGMTLISTVRFCYQNLSIGCPYQNAFWNGAQMVYGDGYASADDVVAHELTHGVTEHESGLFYYMQSGAINEAFSDAWGEFVDLTNGKGNDSDGVRWLMGEDMPIGAIRDMKNPPAFQDPDRIQSPFYACQETDSGRVHRNSGVLNKAVYLMTDGGTFNGKTVAGLGVDKVSRILYRVQADLLTGAGEYLDLYDLTYQACTDLAAQGTAGISQVDCQQVRNATEATEMNKQPLLCGSTEAPVCDAGQTAQTAYLEDFEDHGLVFSRWASIASNPPYGWYFPQTVNPYNNYELYYASSGVWHLWGDDQEVLSDSQMSMTQGVTVPSSGTPYLRFRHAFAFERGASIYYDGGVLEYSANGGPWTDAETLFTHNGYRGTIGNAGNTGNPLYNRKAFVGTSYGYLSSRLNLTGLKGQNVRFRWRIGTDQEAGHWGWFVDDVHIYNCIAQPPTSTPTATATPTQTPTATPSAPWMNWGASSLPLLEPHRPGQVIINYGNIAAVPSDIVGTITGNGVFENGLKTKTLQTSGTGGSATFLIYPSPGAQPGTGYSLNVKINLIQLDGNGTVGWRAMLPYTKK